MEWIGLVSCGYYPASDGGIVGGTFLECAQGATGG